MPAIEIRTKEPEPLCKDKLLLNRLERHLRMLDYEEIPKQAADNATRTGPQSHSFLNTVCSSTLLSSVFVTAILEAVYLMFSQGAALQVGLICFFCITLIIHSIRSTARHIEQKNKLENPQNKHSIFYGLTGKGMIIFGVVIPTIISIYKSFSAPISFSFSSFLCLASFIVPIGIFLAWQNLRGKASSVPTLRLFGIGGACLYQSFSLLSTFESIQLDAGAVWILSYPCGLWLASVWLAVKLWLRPSNSALSKSAAALALAASSIVCLLPSAPNLLTDIKVLSLNSDQTWLRHWANSSINKGDFTRSLVAILNKENTAPQSLRLPLPITLYEEAYLHLTGNTFRPVQQWGYNDAYYASPCIGPSAISGLKISSSELHGNIDAKILDASFDWSFDFNNEFGGQGKEARLQITLPHHSVVTGLQLIPLSNNNILSMSQGVPHPLFAGNLQLLQAYSQEAVRLKDPVIATMIAPDKVMLQCAPILHGCPVRVKLHIASPFSLDAQGNSAKLTLPFISDTNAESVASGKIQIDTSAALTRPNGDSISSGASWAADLTDGNQYLSSTLSSPVATTFNVTDNAGQHSRIKRSIQAGDQPPEKLVIAIDGSADNAMIKHDLIYSLKRFPKDLTCKILFADPQTGIKECRAESASEILNSASFSGVDNNWDLLSKAISVARKNHADVFWIHAAKPWSVNYDWVREIGYNSYCPPALCANSVKIYDFQTLRGDNQIIEKIHASGGDLAPFIEVQRHSDLASDLDEVLSQWNNKRTEASFKFVKANEQIHKDKPLVQGQTDLLALADRQELSELIARGKRSEAEAYASSHQLLSIYTGALCLQSEARPLATPGQMALAPLPPSLPSEPSPKAHVHRSRAHVHRSNAQAQLSSPQAGNSTARRPARHAHTQAPASTGIQVQQDPTIISGVNEAGTVRVNNLATLEALLNIIANGLEIGGLCWGLPMMIVGLLNCRSNAGQNRIVVGIVSITFGLATPGCINMLVASGRDINVFS